jgi:hypothetical protein
MVSPDSPSFSTIDTHIAIFDALFPQVISHITGKAIIYKYNCTYVTFLPKALQWLPLPFG